VQGWRHGGGKWVEEEEDDREEIRGRDRGGRRMLRKNQATFLTSRLLLSPGVWGNHRRRASRTEPSSPGPYSILHAGGSSFRFLGSTRVDIVEKKFRKRVCGKLPDPAKERRRNCLHGCRQRCHRSCKEEEKKMFREDWSSLQKKEP